MTVIAVTVVMLPKGQSINDVNQNHFYIMSIPKKIIPSPVVIHYWAWYYFFWNGRYSKTSRYAAFWSAGLAESAPPPALV